MYQKFDLLSFVGYMTLILSDLNNKYNIKVFETASLFAHVQPCILI